MITIPEHVEVLLQKEADRRNSSKAEGAPDESAQTIAVQLLTTSASSYENSAERTNLHNLFTRYRSASADDKTAILSKIEEALTQAGV